jgi:hypothetical protein
MLSNEWTWKWFSLSLSLPPPFLKKKEMAIKGRKHSA